MKQFNLEEVRRYIQQSSEESKIYIGCDSSRFKKKGRWFAEYASVVVIHINGKNGCKIFGRTDIEEDFDQKKDKPRMRMMAEAQRAAQLYLDLEEAIEYRDCEIHLDIASLPQYGSNVAMKEAIGYVTAMTNVIPLVKPMAWAASACADKYPSIISA